jgi:hypothetical protein
LLLSFAPPQNQVSTGIQQQEQQQQQQQQKELAFKFFLSFAPAS